MTIEESVRAFIIADGTLAAKFATVYPVQVPPKPPDSYAVVRIISGMSFSTLLGASDMAYGRIEITFWAKVNSDAVRGAYRMRTLVAGLIGPMSTGGVSMSVTSTSVPRSVTQDDTLYFGSQFDIMAHIDQSTVS